MKRVTLGSWELVSRYCARLTRLTQSAWRLCSCWKLNRQENTTLLSLSLSRTLFVYICRFHHFLHFLSFFLKLKQGLQWRSCSQAKILDTQKAHFLFFLSFLRHILLSSTHKIQWLARCNSNPIIFKSQSFQSHQWLLA